MSGLVLRAVQKLLIAVAGLLVVPIVVNVGTGGTPPAWLAPYTGWLWPLAIACVVGIAVLELVEPRRSVREVISARRPDDPRNVDRALDQVARYVDLRQRNSLAERVRIALTLDERPDAVRQPVHLVRRVGGGRFEVRAVGDIAAVFEELSGSLLVLGAPGAGKSTQLLDLAERLIAQGRAERAHDVAADPPVPVVVDLAEWSRSSARRRWPWSRRRSSSPPALSTWLGTALRERYGIPPLVSGSWLADDRFVLLLDGLDEVREADRERCVREINGLQRSVTRVVVCSRTADYEALRGDLLLQGAVEIQPFRPDEVAAFLSAVSPQLRGVADALAADEELSEMLTTPLMLNIMALAYGEGSAPPMASGGDWDTRRRLLFDSYVVEVLARRRAGDWNADAERTLGALQTLARISAALNSGVQVVRLSSWATVGRGLDAAQQRVVTGWLTIAGGCSAAVGVGLAAAARVGFLTSLLFGAITWGICALFLDEARIVTVHERWTRLRQVALFAWAALIGTVTCLEVIILSQVLALMLPTWLGPPAATPVTIVAAVASWAVFALGPATSDRPLRVPPARSLVVLVVLTAGAVVVAVVFSPRAAGSGIVTPFTLFLSIVGLVGGAFIGLVLGERLAHQLCRLPLMLAGDPDPWRRDLLRFATDRSLLSFVDTEYRFVHLLSRDHLAACDPAALAAAVAIRRAQLAQRA